MQRWCEAGQWRDDVGGRVAEGDRVDLRAWRGGQQSGCQGENGAAVGRCCFGEDNSDAVGVLGCDCREGGKLGGWWRDQNWCGEARKESSLQGDGSDKLSAWVRLSEDRIEDCCQVKDVKRRSVGCCDNRAG